MSLCQKNWLMGVLSDWQNSPVEGQRDTLRLCYAKDRAPTSGPAADAMQVMMSIASLCN